MSTSKPKFVIIDGNALLHRAWHALPPLTTKAGELVNAVYGFTMILLKVLKDLKPDFMAITFDKGKITFRHKEYKEYKATRIKQPDELYNQIPRVKEVVAAFNIPIFEKENYEADDIIATLVKEKEVKKIQSIIVTGDLDTLQLVDKNTEVYTMHKGISDTITYDIVEVKRRFDGLTPKQMVDFKALRGDPSDNIPGVRGIGEKGAINLLKDFKTLENLYQNLDSPKIKERQRKLLAEHKEEAMLSKKLATIETKVPIKFKLADCRLIGYNLNKVIPLFQELEFKSLLNRLPKELQCNGQTQLKLGSSLLGLQKVIKKTKDNYQLIDTEQNFKNFLNQLKKQKEFALDTETSDLNPFNSELLGISFCWKKGEAFYILAQTDWLKELKPVIEDTKIKKYGHNIKFDLEVLKEVGINLGGIVFDTMIASYLLNPGSRQHNLDNLVFSELGYQMEPIENLIGKGRTQISLKEVPKEKVARYSCEDVDFTFRLVNPLKKQLQEKNNLGLLEKIEMPLIEVLATMERNGVKIDLKLLENLSKKVKKLLHQLEVKIHRLAHTKFNINSPIQLKEVLFEKLKISSEGLGRTKTGVSTAAGELEKLKGQHKIIDLILEYRELSKLKSTYLDALPKLINPKTGRVHTSFNQTITATGRLSSSEPNLQNIPIRTELGQKIRQAFISENGFKILAADYSQIELRIIASLANDKKMLESFEKGEDIHTRTAAEIHKIPLKEVNRAMRRQAKVINFGMIYGQGVYGLSKAAGISFEKAQEFIDKYFQVHTGIKKYLEQTKDLAKKKGYVETWFGRRRYLPEINSGVQQIKAQAERMAINHPIQGTAADLMKLAMIEIHQKLLKISRDTKMILQVHDELVFEVPKNEIKKVAGFVRKTMENIYKLRAPVETQVEIGNNWGELKKIG